MSGRIVLVRHGDVPGITPPSFRGRADLALTPLGRRQAEATRDLLASDGDIASIFCSPLSRCRATASIIAELGHIVPEPLDALNDLDYGRWQGLTHEAAHAQFPDAYASWRSSPGEMSFPDGESLPALSRRCVPVLASAASRSELGRVVVVSHDSVNRVLLLHALGLPLNDYWRIRQDACGVSVIEAESAGWRIVSLNETAHLRSVRG